MRTLTTQDTPAWAAKIITDTGGNNPHGGPLYRLIWGWNRMSLVGGQWVDRDSNTNQVIRREIAVRPFPKYSHLGVNKWFLERWYPPEHFGRRARWEALTLETIDGLSVAALGPYPENGDYEWAATVETREGKFKSLTLSLVEDIALGIKEAEAKYQETIRAMRASTGELDADLTPQQLKDKQEAEAAPDPEDLAIVKDAGRAFDGEPTIVVP